MSAETIERADPEDSQARYPKGYPSKFVRFHAENPAVCAALTAHAYRLQARGETSVGMRFLFEWERRYGQHPFLDNNLIRAYTLYIEEREPALRGFFPTRSMEEEREAAAFAREEARRAAREEAARRQPALMFDAGEEEVN